MPKLKEHSTMGHHKQIVLQVSKKGIDLVRDPMLNKGTAFSEKEREEFERLLKKYGKDYVKKENV